MTKAIETDQCLQELALDFGRLVNWTTRPRPHDGRWRESVTTACKNLSNKAMSACGEMASRSENLVPLLERIRESMAEYSHEVANGPSAARLKEMSHNLGEQYEDLRRKIRNWRRTQTDGLVRSQVSLKPLKPINYSRNLFHVGMGIFAVAMYEFFLTPFQALVVMAVVASAVVLLEVARVVFPGANEIITWPFRRIMRPWEKRRPNSASYFTLAAFLVVLIMPPFSAKVGVLVLAFADPAATIVGRQFGRLKIYRNKSLVGFLTFFLMATIVSVAMYALSGPSMEPLRVAGMISTTALAGAMTELACDRLDDNLAIPLMTGGIATLWYM